MKIPHRKRKVTTITLDPEIVEKARKYNLNISRLSESTLKETIRKLESEAKPMGAPEIKKGGVKKVTTKTWGPIAVVIIVAAALGTWALWPAEEGPVTSPETWNKVASGLPGTASAIPTGSNSGIIAIHFMRNGSGYSLSENLMAYTEANDNRIGSITSTGGEITNFPYGTAFDVVLDVVGHTDNMGVVSRAYLISSLGAYSDAGSVTIATENSVDGDETVYSGVEESTDNIHVNVQKSTMLNKTLTADDNMHLENIDLWLRG